MKTIATHFMSTLPKNFNYESILFGSFMNTLQSAYVDLGYPVDTVPTIVFYPGNHHCIECYDGSALAFASTADFFDIKCKIYWIKEFTCLPEAKEYVAKLSSPAHNDTKAGDTPRTFFNQTKH